MRIAKNDIARFIAAQNVPLYGCYNIALMEISSGRKMSHWIWYIFPQLRGINSSSRSDYFGITDIDEAKRYLAHPVLGTRLREITNAALSHRHKKAEKLFGSEIDAEKVKSCMTLFDHISPNDIFAEMLSAFYNESRCTATLAMIKACK